MEIGLAEENLIRKLVSASKCGVCGRHYEMANIDVLGQEEEVWFLQVSCPTCRSRSIMAAIVKEGKGPGKETDLTPAEIHKFRNVLITSDDVVEMQSFLKDFDGDFSQLFEE